MKQFPSPGFLTTRNQKRSHWSGIREWDRCEENTLWYQTDHHRREKTWKIRQRCQDSSRRLVEGICSDASRFSRRNGWCRTSWSLFACNETPMNSSFSKTPWKNNCIDRENRQQQTEPFAIPRQVAGISRPGMLPWSRERSIKKEDPQYLTI